MVVYARQNQTLIDHINSMINFIESTYNSHQVKSKAITSSIFHDLGKGTLSFQYDTIKNNRSAGFRHEILSALIYVTIVDEIDHDVLFSILTHHKKLPTIEKEYLKNIRKYSELVDELYIDDVNRILSEYDYRELAINDIKRNIYELRRIIKTGELRKNISYTSILTKGLLQQADHLSAILSEINIQNRVLSLKDCKSNIYEYFNKMNYEFNEIQQQVLKIDNGNIVINAKTGSGKTETALLYAEKIIEKTGGHIIYVLNNNTSIEAMYNRLSKIYGENCVTILTSKTFYNLLSSLYNSDISIKEIKSYESLIKKMYYPIKLTTQYQLEKILYGFKDYAMILTELENSVIIFDEYHLNLTTPTSQKEKQKLDDFTRLFKLLLNKQLNTSLILMSATHNKQLNKYFDYVITDTKNTIITHIIEHSNSTFDDIEIVKENSDYYLIMDNKKIKLKPPVLIITNSIRDAINVYIKIPTNKKILLHSLFKNKDKQTKISELTNISRYDFIITTQIIEVSVDINAKTLITEVSPLPSFIQRLGRVNRKKEEVNKTNVILLENRSYKPYSKQEINTTKEIIKGVKYVTDCVIDELVNEYYNNFIEINKIIENVESDDITKYEFIENRVEYYTQFDSIDVILYDDYEKYLEFKNTDKKRALKYLLDNIITIRYYHLEKIRDSIVSINKKLGLIIINDIEYNSEYGLNLFK